MADDQDGDEPTTTKKPDADLGDAGKKALDEERKARREAEKALRDVQDQLKELTDKDKSEVEKLRDEVANLTKERDGDRLKVLRSDVAMAKGLTAAQAKRLVGSTQEELEADADEILEAFPAQGAATPPPSRKPSAAGLSGGGEPNSERVETSPAKLAESVPRF